MKDDTMKISFSKFVLQQTPRGVGTNVPATTESIVWLAVAAGAKRKAASRHAE